MFARFVVALTCILFATAAQAAGYGNCTFVAVDNRYFIKPPVPVVSATKISEEIFVLLVKGAEPIFGDSVVPINKLFEEDIHYFLEDAPGTPMWIGIAEGVDRANKPGLIMVVLADYRGDCAWHHVGDRVYEARGNAPTIFWDAIATWEQSHPSSRLIYAE